MIYAINYESVFTYHTLFERKTVVYSQKIQNELKYTQRQRKAGGEKNEENKVKV